MKYWHAYTRGLEKGLIFRSREDFVYGMNGVPVCALMCGVDVLSFTLMTNHVHFVVTGREDSCLGFMRAYRRRLSKLADMGGSNAVGIKEIPDKEAFMRTVAYVLRNSLSSEPEVLPLFYEWGSGSCYFRKDSLLLPTEYRRVADFGYREIRKMLHSNLALPDDYRLTPEGTICPANYVNRKKVEEIFGSPARLMLYLSRNMKMEMSLSEGVLGTVPYADGELLGSVREICLLEFGTSDAGTLGVEQRCRLAEYLRKQFGCSIKQMARLSGLSTELLKKIYGR